MTDHIHEPEDYNRVLDLSYCRCGYELKDKRWRAPRTFEGWSRSVRAMKEQA